MELISSMLSFLTIVVTTLCHRKIIYAALMVLETISLPSIAAPEEEEKRKQPKES